MRRSARNKGDRPMPPGNRCPDPRIEDIIDRFEEAWHGPLPPSIDAFLPDDAGLVRPLLIELIHIDLEYRLKRGERIRVESYLRCYPELADDRDAMADLLTAEFELRRRRERRLTPEEFLQRL